MTAESIPSQARALMLGTAIGLLPGVFLGVTLMAISESKEYEPEVMSMQVPEGKTSYTNETTRAYVASQTAAGSAIGTPGCNDTAFVVLYKQGVVWSHSKMSLTDGFELDAGPGQKWHVKLLKP